MRRNTLLGVPQEIGTQRLRRVWSRIQGTARGAQPRLGNSCYCRHAQPKVTDELFWVEDSALFAVKYFALHLRHTNLRFLSNSLPTKPLAIRSPSVEPQLGQVVFLSKPLLCIRAISPSGRHKLFAGFSKKTTADILRTFFSSSIGKI